MSFPWDKARGVRLVVLDVDGVLTDGKIRINDAGEEVKAFDVRDGHGIKMLQRAGIAAAILTGRRSRVVEHRARELGIGIVLQGRLDKEEALAEILAAAGCKAEEAAFMGDDVVDAPAMRRCGLALAPADAHPAVRRLADWVADFPGGRGAVRQACEALILAQGKWDEVIGARYGIAPEDAGWMRAPF